MPSPKAPTPVKGGIERACKKVASKVGKATEKVSDKDKAKKAKELIEEHVCKEADKKLLKLAAEELAKYAKTKSAKPAPGSIPKVDAKPNPKPPGSGVPSLTIPISEVTLNEALGTKGKFELKVWADPKNFEKADKGVMLYFTVTKW